MKTNFQITALENSFNHLFELDENTLTKMGAIKMTVDSKPGFPCRVTLEDAEISEEVILLQYKHHDTTSPYQASGPIFVRKNVQKTKLEINEIPIMLRHRLLSIRGYDSNGMMIDARTTEGEVVEDTIQELFANSSVKYLHVHNSGPGCYNCKVFRAK